LQKFDVFPQWFVHIPDEATKYGQSISRLY
jgi:hypothetical protein